MGGESPPPHTPVNPRWVRLEFLGAEERSASSLCPAITGTRQAGFIPPPRKRLQWVGAIEETPWVILTIRRRSRDRERVGRGVSWQPVVQKTALGKGFWSLSPMRWTAGGHIRGHTMCLQLPQQPATLENASASPRLTALHRTRQQSW